MFYLLFVFKMLCSQSYVPAASHEIYESCRKIGNLNLKNLANLPNFRVNSNQCPQECRIIRVSKFLGIYGN